jgi:hypothetical protein
MIDKEKLENKFLLLLARKLEKEDVSADVSAMSQEELAAFKVWLRQKKHKAEAELWYEKQEQRAEYFARKFSLSSKP